MTVSKAAREPGAREIVRSHRLPRAQYLQVKGDNLLWLYQMVEGGGLRVGGGGNEKKTVPTQEGWSNYIYRGEWKNTHWKH